MMVYRLPDAGTANTLHATTKATKFHYCQFYRINVLRRQSVDVIASSYPGYITPLQLGEFD